MHIARDLILLAAFLLASVTSVAHADVVDPPPASCPTGSLPATSHTGPHCVVDDCSLSSCSTGDTCEPVGLCLVQVPCGGRISPDAGPCLETHVVGLCSGEGTCSTGTCSTRDVCVGPGEPRTAGSCGCRAGRGGSSGAALAALGLATVLHRRRRTPRSR